MIRTLSKFPHTLPAVASFAFGRQLDTWVKEQARGSMNIYITLFYASRVG
jgi:hypothetical protein